MQRRLPKFGFRSRISQVTAEVRLDELNAVTAEVIDLAALQAAGVVRKNMKRGRVMLRGAINKAVVVKGVAVTKGARAAIEAAGGRVEA
jgi:large subunit ribosomal protein L15